MPRRVKSKSSRAIVELIRAPARRTNPLSPTQLSRFNHPLSRFPRGLVGAPIQSSPLFGSEETLVESI
jgi:hypothetical protein